MTEKKKNELNRDFYVSEIGVLDWLYDENKFQKIRLDRAGCYHYKYNNQLHRVQGPAIEYFNGTGNQFYLFGKKVSWEEHTNKKRDTNIDICLIPPPTPII
jgi:hypothetical protein